MTTDHDDLLTHLRARQAIATAQNGGGWAYVFKAADGDLAALRAAMAMLAGPHYSSAGPMPALLVEAAVNTALELAEHIEQNQRDGG